MKGVTTVERLQNARWSPFLYRVTSENVVSVAAVISLFSNRFLCVAALLFSRLGILFGLFNLRENTYEKFRHAPYVIYTKSGPMLHHIRVIEFPHFNSKTSKCPRIRV